MRFFNNTRYKTLSAQDLLAGVYHYLYVLSEEKRKTIESIELNDETMTVFGEDCVYMTVDVTKPLRVTGEIRWFDESSGEGVIRLKSGRSLPFFSCNCEGADSQYPELVSNVQFAEGEKVTAELSNDPYMVEALGLISVRKVS